MNIKYFRPNNGLRIKECILDASGQYTNNYTENNTNIDQKVSNKVLQNTEINNVIQSSYDKCFEVINSVKQAINQNIDVSQMVKVKQSNKVTGISLGDGSNNRVDLNMENIAEIRMAMVIGIQTIMQMDATNKEKAVISDMLGVSQKADVSNSATNSASATADITNKTNNETSQDTFTVQLPRYTQMYLERYGLNKKYRKAEHFNFMDNIILKECFLDFSLQITDNDTINNNNVTQSLENWTEQNTKQNNIQQYVNTLKSKSENISENVQNMTNNIKAATDVDQTNEIDGLDFGSGTGNVLNLKMANKSITNVTTEFKNYLTQCQKIMNENEKDIKSDVKSDQSAAAINAAKNEASAGATVVNDTSNVTSQSTGSIIKMIIAIVVVMIVGGMCFKGFGAGGKDPFYDDPNYEEGNKAKFSGGYYNRYNIF